MCGLDKNQKQICCGGVSLYWFSPIELHIRLKALKLKSKYFATQNMRGI